VRAVPDARTYTQNSALDSGGIGFDQTDPGQVAEESSIQLQSGH